VLIVTVQQRLVRKTVIGVPRVMLAHTRELNERRFNLMSPLSTHHITWLKPTTLVGLARGRSLLLMSAIFSKMRSWDSLSGVSVNQCCDRRGSRLLRRVVTTRRLPDGFVMTFGQLFSVYIGHVTPIPLEVFDRRTPSRVYWLAVKRWRKT